jgi:ribonucleoside-diphosphate reductase alpha chain
MAVELVDNKQHLVIKRDGREEPYSEEKLKKVLMWACDGSEVLVNSVLSNLEIRIYNRIDITTLFDEVIDTVYNMITRLTPVYDDVAKKLYLQKMYKETWGLYRNEYPNLKDVLEMLQEEEVIIDVLDYFTAEEIQMLHNTIVPSRDFTSTYLGLKVFFDKYSLKVNNKPVELLQHGFMRMAIQAYLHDSSEDRIHKIINRYNNLSTYVYTEATPKFMNSLLKDAAFASCVIHKMEDSTESINKVVSDIGQYSRRMGGNGLDISSIRSFGSAIGNSGGVSGGAVPVVRYVQSAIELYNQKGSRPGACIAYYNWWTADVHELLMLLDEGGTESQRARNLKYGVKINRLFLRAVENNENIYLFDPKDVPLLNETWGEEFDRLYKEYVEKRLYKSTVKARDLAYLLATQRAETGNIYLFFTENVNENTPFKDTIYSSNLCNEIYLPTKAAKFIKTEAKKELGENRYTTTTEEVTGLTAICNLSSVNVVKWMSMADEDKHKVAAELLEASDNLIDYGTYATKDGELFNKMFRAIGIGMIGLAHYFAKHDIRWGSDESYSHMYEISKSMYDVFTEESEKLAIKRGNFEWHYKTKLTRPSRFATIFSVAPTATSSLIAGTTEGIEPLNSVFIEKTGTYSVKQLAPELTVLGNKYDLAKDIPTEVLYRMASIRQQFIDQGQSINTYQKDSSSAGEIIKDIILAEKLGLKGLYYLQSTTSVKEECESCSS